MGSQQLRGWMIALIARNLLWFCKPQCNMEVSKTGVPQNHPFSKDFSYKPSIFGIPLFEHHPYVGEINPWLLIHLWCGIGQRLLLPMVETPYRETWQKTDPTVGSSFQIYHGDKWNLSHIICIININVNHHIGTHHLYPNVKYIHISYTYTLYTQHVQYIYIPAGARGGETPKKIKSNAGA